MNLLVAHIFSVTVTLFEYESIEATLTTRFYNKNMMCIKSCIDLNPLLFISRHKCKSKFAPRLMELAGKRWLESHGFAARIKRGLQRLSLRECDVVRCKCQILVTLWQRVFRVKCLSRHAVLSVIHFSESQLWRQTDPTANILDYSLK